MNHGRAKETPRTPCRGELPIVRRFHSFHGGIIRTIFAPSLVAFLIINVTALRGQAPNNADALMAIVAGMFANPEISVSIAPESDPAYFLHVMRKKA
jgi:hypothetical protein